ncbi:hypothetical protein ACPMJQ_29210 [Streptomyces pseudogriseolus]|uniref:hypothetical protein n=1 Tax=Streptomyces pseudogriseolus TaxID=36817 RepID=UPI003FA214DC
MGEIEYRTVVLVEVNGLATDCALFETACTELAWEVLERPAHPSGSQMCRVQYVVEARMAGAALGARRGVREALDRIAARSNLDVVMLAIQPVRHEFQDRTAWRAHTVPPAAAPWGIPRHAWPRLRHWLVRGGWWDLERDVTARTAEEALRLARRPLPGAAPLPAGVRVRPLDPSARAESHPRHVRIALLWRIAAVSLVLYVGGRLLGTGLRVHNVIDVPSGLLGAMLLIWGAGLSALLLRDMVRLAGAAGTSRGRIGVSVQAAALCGLCAWAISDGANSSQDPSVLLLTAGAVAAPRGLYLFISRSTWRTWVPWLLPALLPIVIMVLPGIGSMVFLAYLYPFGAEPGDVDIPPYWQLYAALRWSVVVLAFLQAPALYGYLRHLHAPVALRRGTGLILAVTVTGVALLIGARYVVLEPLRASTEAYKAALDDHTPATYYGISPEWVCVRPVEGMTPGEVPAQGGEFAPGRTYLKLGDSDGAVVLWWAGATERRSKTLSLSDDETLKLPLSKIRITPADDPSRGCPP